MIVIAMITMMMIVVVIIILIVVVVMTQESAPNALPTDLSRPLRPSSLGWNRLKVSKKEKLTPKRRQP